MHLHLSSSAVNTYGEEKEAPASSFPSTPVTVRSKCNRDDLELHNILKEKMHPITKSSKFAALRQFGLKWICITDFVLGSLGEQANSGRYGGFTSKSCLTSIIPNFLNFHTETINLKWSLWISALKMAAHSWVEFQMARHNRNSDHISFIRRNVYIWNYGVLSAHSGQGAVLRSAGSSPLSKGTNPFELNMFSSPKFAVAQNWHSFFLRAKFPYRFRRLLAHIPNCYS
jgi:hypothetical protein